MPARVSVIVPAHNYGRYLPLCVRSVRAQTYAQWECIIVDDGSTDDTPAVCQRLAATDARISFTRLDNRGPSAARNSGIKLAKGEYLQFLDADDMIEPDKIRYQVERLDEAPGIDIVVGDAALFRDTRANDLQPRAVRALLGKNPLSALVAENPFVVNAPLLRRRVIDTVGPFDEALLVHEDWDLWLRCALAGCRFAVASAPGTKALVRQHAASISASREKMLRNAIAFRKRLAARLPDDLKSLNTERLADMQLTLGFELMQAGRVADGWALYREGLVMCRNKVRTLVHLLSLVPGAQAFRRFSRRHAQ